jgi:hypothetical protein
MAFKTEYKGSLIYIKALDRNIEVSEDNKDILEKHAPEVFESTKQKAEKKNDSPSKSE